jgi:hypothetical protein
MTYVIAHCAYGQTFFPDNLERRELTFYSISVLSLGFFLRVWFFLSQSVRHVCTGSPHLCRLSRQAPQFLPQLPFSVYIPVP